MSAGPVWLDKLYIRSIEQSAVLNSSLDADVERPVALWADRELYITNVTMHGNEDTPGGAMWVEASTLVVGTVLNSVESKLRS